MLEFEIELMLFSHTHCLKSVWTSISKLFIEEVGCTPISETNKLNDDVTVTPYVKMEMNGVYVTDFFILIP